MDTKELQDRANSDSEALNAEDVHGRGEQKPPREDDDPGATAVTTQTVIKRENGKPEPVSQSRRGPVPREEDPLVATSDKTVPPVQRPDPGGDEPVPRPKPGVERGGEG